MTDKQINLAIDAITHVELVMDFSDVVLDALNSVIAFLATMDEQSERKKGKWIKTYRDGFGNLIGYCNQCRVRHPVDNFCANCGADMREG